MIDSESSRLLSYLNKSPADREKYTVKFAEPHYAMIYPLLKEHIERIFAGKDVFCKYTGRNFRIGAGTKILFYASQGSQQVLGEAKVKSVEYLTPDETAKKYESRLFITKDELEKYRGLRPKEAKILVLQLEGIRKYIQPKVSEKIVTMSGQQLSEIDYRNFMKS